MSNNWNTQISKRGVYQCLYSNNKLVLPDYVKMRVASRFTFLMTDWYVHEQHMASGWQLQHHWQHYVWLLCLPKAVIILWYAPNLKCETNYAKRPVSHSLPHMLHVFVGKILWGQFYTRVYILIHKLYSVSVEFRKILFIKNIFNENIFMKILFIKIRA